MKIELSFLERGYYANLLRARASRLRGNLAQRSMSAIRVEIEDEIADLERRAVDLDDAIEPATLSDKEPIRVPAQGGSDVTYLDERAGGR